MPSGKDTKVSVEVAGRRMTLSNLDKILYPGSETTKGEVLNYYARIAPVILPHLAGRPVTRVRYPDGVDRMTFFEKNLPSGAPAWLPRVTLEHSEGSLTYPLVTGLDSLTYLVNLASLELHVPQWRVVQGEGGAAERGRPDRLVVDLDPGPGAGLTECSEVALLVRERLTAIGLTTVPVTSGSKGLQVYAALPGVHTSDEIAGVAKQLAQELAAARPELVVWQMTKTLRPGKVFLDWSQNVAAKTTICPYSTRGRVAPFVATPRTWDEVERGAAQPDSLEHLTIEQVLARVDRDGDLAAALLPKG
ncbi:MAG TPA: non-homologous end-joining DNA ligase [Dermatophilaceae bacterium]|nr:non-homologous end-joining DNA ligase [Dermatophilaceae bacterium]